MHPFLSRYTRLLQNSYQQIWSYVRLMWIWNPHVNVTSRHEHMLPSRKGASETQILQSPNQHSPRNWLELCHAPSNVFRLYFRVVGMNFFLRIFKTIHSSKTSRKVFSHSLSVLPSAQTPWNPGRLPKYSFPPSTSSKRAFFVITSLMYSVIIPPVYQK